MSSRQFVHLIVLASYFAVCSAGLAEVLKEPPRGNVPAGNSEVTNSGRPAPQASAYRFQDSEGRHWRIASFATQMGALNKGNQDTSDEDCNRFGPTWMRPSFYLVNAMAAELAKSPMAGSLNNATFWTGDGAGNTSRIARAVGIHAKAGGLLDSKISTIDTVTFQGASVSKSYENQADKKVSHGLLCVCTDTPKQKCE